MLDQSNEACSQVINAICVGLDASRVAIVAVGENSRHSVIASRPTMHSASVPPALVDVVARTKRTTQRVVGQTSIAVSPIVGRGDVAGAVYVERETGDGFGAPEVQVIEALALQILAEEVAEPPRLRRNTIVDAFGLDDPSSVVWGVSEVEEISLAEIAEVMIAYGEMKPRPPFTLGGAQKRLAQTVEDVTIMADSHVAAVLLVDGVDFTPVAVGATSSAPNVAAEDLISRTVVEEVLWTGEPVMSVDARRGDLGMSAQSIQRLEVTMVMCVPVIADDETIGAVYTAKFSLGSSFDETTRDKLLEEAKALAPVLVALRPAEG